MIAEGVEFSGREPEDSDAHFTVKLLSDKGVVVRTWHGAQCPYFYGRIFGFSVDGQVVNVTGNVIYEPE